MAVTADRLELPLCVFDTVSELARWAGRKYESIKRAIREHTKDLELNCYYIKVDLMKDFENFQKINIKITFFL